MDQNIAKGDHLRQVRDASRQHWIDAAETCKGFSNDLANCR
jgi:hypothetical protein